MMAWASDNPVVHNALGSATAGIISRLFTHPLDTAKAQMQAGGLNAAHLKGPWDALFKTYAREGVRGWYRGFGVILVGGTPGTILYLCGYDMFKNNLSSLAYNDQATIKSDSKEFTIHFASGMLAETCACLVYVPVDVIKERLQVQSLYVQGHSKTNENLYKGSADAFRKIMRSEGLRGIYKGYGATLASFGPFSAFYFVFYEKLKDLAKQQDPSYNQKPSQNYLKKQDGDLSFAFLLGCSCSAGAMASFITSPLDMAKLRLQIQRGNLVSNHEAPTVSYRGMLDCLSQVYTENGIRGLFRGAGARVLHFAPATTITMTCYEKCRAFFARALSSPS